MTIVITSTNSRLRISSANNASRRYPSLAAFKGLVMLKALLMLLAGEDEEEAHSIIDVCFVVSGE